MTPEAPVPPPHLADLLAELSRVVGNEPRLAAHARTLVSAIRGLDVPARDFDLFACLAVDVLGDHDNAQQLVEAIARIRPVVVLDGPDLG